MNPLIETAQRSVLGIVGAILNGWPEAYFIGGLIACLIAVLVLRDLRSQL